MLRRPEYRLQQKKKNVKSLLLIVIRGQLQRCERIPDSYVSF